MALLEVLIGFGFIASTLFFGVLLLVLRKFCKKELNSFSLDFEILYEQIDLTSDLKIS